LTPDKLLECAKTKQLTFEYIEQNVTYRTKYSRIIKLINHGFHFDPTSAPINHVGIITDIIEKSFSLPHDYILDRDNPDHRNCKFGGKCCVCPGKDINFISTCLNQTSYDLAKKCYAQLTLLTKIKLPNSTIDILFAYACLMKDFDYAFKLIKWYNLRKKKATMKYVPMILRQNGDFSTTIKFLNVIKNDHRFIHPTLMFCNVPQYALSYTFTIDAIYAGDLDYYDNLVKYDKAFDIDALTTWPQHYENIKKRYDQEISFRKIKNEKISTPEQKIIFI